MSAHFSLSQSHRLMKFSAVVALLLMLVVSLTACGDTPADDPTQQGDTLNTEELQSALSGMGSPVVGARASEAPSGLSKNLIVAVVVADGTVQVTPELIRETLRVVSAHTPSDYRGAVMLGFEYETSGVVLIEQAALEAGVPTNLIAIDETVTFTNMDELSELVRSW